MDLVASNITIKLPVACADVGSIEDVVYVFYRERKKIQADSSDMSMETLVELDMQEVKYITAPGLIYLIALTDKLQRSGQTVKFALPISSNVRDILRIWRFPYVLKEVTGIPFIAFVREEDHSHFGENKRLVGDPYQKFANNDEGLAELMKKDFFAIQSIPFENEDEKANAVNNQHSKWYEDIVKSILKRHLEGYDNSSEDLIPNRIIYECMTNAVRHANSKRLITASFFDRNGGMLTITYWDNDKTIIETLREGLEKQDYIRSPNSPAEKDNRSIHFTFEAKFEGDTELSDGFYNSDIDPQKDCPDALLLLCSFYPGITRDPNGILQHGNPNDPGALKGPGMGLTTLLNATIDLLGGSVAVRTGRFFANIKKGKREQKKAVLASAASGTTKSHTLIYKIKVKQFDSYFPPFEGNMITVRIPLRKNQ